MKKPKLRRWFCGVIGCQRITAWYRCGDKAFSKIKRNRKCTGVFIGLAFDKPTQTIVPA